MTGGVSLAVWMGGVTNELNRMLHGDALYGELLDHLAYKPRVDVITGSSAGGLNGAVLATAIANPRTLAPQRDLGRSGRARTSDAFTLRPLGSFTPPRRREVPPRVKDAFQALIDNTHPFKHLPLREPDPPLHLTVTTTLLDGEPHVFADDFGSLISEPDHRGEFRFTRGSSHEEVRGLNDDAVARNDFVGEHAAERLALAVRCSASFPYAFEASYSPGRDDQPATGASMNPGSPGSRTASSRSTAARS